MLSIYDLAIYKEMYKGHKILYALFNNREFVFKALGRKEYQDIINLTSDEYELEDAICQTSLIYPEECIFATHPMAGITNNIAPIIVELSGFSDLSNVLDMYKESKGKMNNFDQQCMALVKVAFPEYRYDEIEEWTWEQLMDFTAKAENMMALKGLPPIELVNRKDEVEEEAKKQTEEYNQDEFVHELREKGIDPIMYFQDKLFQKKDYLDFPLIGGIHWENEGVLNDIRQQMEAYNR